MKLRRVQAVTSQPAFVEGKGGVSTSKLSFRMHHLVGVQLRTISARTSTNESTHFEPTRVTNDPSASHPSRQMPGTSYA